MKRLIFCFFLLIFLVGCAEEDLPPAPSPPGGDSGVGRAVGGVQISAQLPAWAASLKYTDIEPSSARFGDVIVLTVEKTRDVKKDFLVFSEIYVFNKKVYESSRVGLWEIAEADSSLSGRITEKWAKDKAVFRIPISSERFLLGQNYVVVYWCIDSGTKSSNGKKIWNCNGNKWGLGAFDVVEERYPSVLAEREIANNVYLSSSRIVSPPDAFTGTIGDFEGMGDSYVGSYKHRAPDEFETEVIITKLDDVDKFKESLASVVHLLDWVELAGPTCGFESSGYDFVSFSWLSGTYWVTVKTYSDEHNAALIGNYATVYRSDCDLLDELLSGVEEEYCGDGIIQSGEECEPPGTSDCDEFCMKITPVAPPKTAPPVCPDALSVWSRADEDVNVWYSEYYEGTKEWAVSSNRPAKKVGEAASLAIVPRDDFDPDVSSWPVLNTCGKAIAVWSNQPSDAASVAAGCPASSTVYYSIWDHSNGWTVPAVLAQNGCDPAVAADYSGNSVAVFVRSDGLYASGFNGASWSAPVSVQKAAVSLPQISWTPGTNNWFAVWESGGKAWFATLNNAGVVLSGPSQLGSAVGGSVALPSKRLSVDSQWSGSSVTAVYESPAGLSYVQLSPVTPPQSVANIYAPDVVYDFSDVYHIIGKSGNDLKYFDADGSTGNAAGSVFVDGRPAHTYIPSNVDIAVWHSEDELAPLLSDIYWSRRDSSGWSAAKKLVTGGLADFDKNADIAPLFKAACESGSFDPAIPCSKIIYYRPSQPVPVPAGPGPGPGGGPPSTGIPSVGADGTATATTQPGTTITQGPVVTCTSSDQCGAGSGKQCSQGFECVNCKCVEKPVWVKLIDCSATGIVPCMTTVCPQFTVGSPCSVDSSYVCTSKPAGQQFGNYACRLLSEQVQAYCTTRNIANCNPAVAKIEILAGASVDAGPPAVQPPLTPAVSPNQPVDAPRLVYSAQQPVTSTASQYISINTCTTYCPPRCPASVSMNNLACNAQSLSPCVIPAPQEGLWIILACPSALQSGGLTDTNQPVITPTPQPSYTATPTPQPVNQYVAPQPAPRPSGGIQYPQPTPYTDVPISSTAPRSGRALFTGESSYSGNAPAMIMIVGALVLLLVLYLFVYRKK